MSAFGVLNAAPMRARFEIVPIATTTPVVHDDDAAESLTGDGVDSLGQSFTHGFRPSGPGSISSRACGSAINGSVAR
jgi:hypothetical protein